MDEQSKRIQERAYRIWLDEGCPEGRADTHWDMASELVAIEENHGQTLKPVPKQGQTGPTGEPVEPLEAVENAGEFPTLTDQGEERTYPAPSKR
jgi:hypothetical protein